MKSLDEIYKIDILLHVSDLTLTLFLRFIFFKNTDTLVEIIFSKDFDNIFM